MYTLVDMSDEQVDDLLTRLLEPPRATKERRQELNRRWACIREKHKELGYEKIADTFNDPNQMAEAKRFVTTTFNPWRRIVNKTATAADQPARRTLKGAGKRMERRFLRLLDGLNFDLREQAYNRYQVALNTVITLLRPSQFNDGRPTVDIEVIHGGIAEVELAPDAPLSDEPAVLAYLLDTGKDPWMRDQDKEVVATVDAERWVFWNARKEPLRVVEHGLGAFPGATLRGTIPEGVGPNAWWDWEIGCSVTETTKTVLAAAATMDQTRKAQFGKLVALLFGEQQEADDGDEGQHLGAPEGVLALHGDNLRLIVESFETSVRGFREHIEFIESESAEQVTGASSVLVNPQPGQEQSDVAHVLNHLALLKLNRRQSAGLRAWNLRLLPRLCGLAELIGMEDAVPRAVVERTLEVQPAQMHLVDTPLQRLMWHKEAMGVGASSPTRYVQELKGVSEEAAAAEVEANLNATAKMHNLQAKHHVPVEKNAEPDFTAPGESPQAQTGRMGGRASPAEGTQR